MLREADEHNSYNLETLSALVLVNREGGDKQAALVAARKLAEALPGDPSETRLIPEMERAK